MSTAVIAATCLCGSFSPEVQRCPDHHRYFRSGRELASVTKVLKSTWPIPPDYSKADPDVLEKARLRGVLVDHLFTQYIRRERVYIPAGTREDIKEESKELYQKLKSWYGDLKSWYGDLPACQAQVILANDEMAGTCDLDFPDAIWDVKCTYNIEATYQIQLGLYAMLKFEQTGIMPKQLGIVHVTKRFAAPRFIEFGVNESYGMALTVRDMWRLVKKVSA